MFTHFKTLADDLYSSPDSNMPEQVKESEQQREALINRFNEELDSEIKKVFRKLVES